MTDEEVINILWPNKIPLLNRYLNNGHLPINIIDYLKTRYNDSLSLYESLYRIKHQIEIRPICPKCMKPVKFSKKGFTQFCSKSCAINQDNIKKHVKNKYGVDNVFQLKYVKEKISKTCLYKYGVKYYVQSSQFKEKSKKTLIKHYGVDNPLKNNYIKDKIRQTTIERYGAYGFNTNKQKNTCLTKYGVDNPSKSPLIKEKLSKILSSKEVQDKINNTKKKNYTLNSSNEENIAYDILKQDFPDIIRQYRSDAYPFSCDFFIPSIDTYIECQFGQFHHGRPYLGTEKDLADVEELYKRSNKIKANTGRAKTRYDEEIKTWTVRDVNKREIAKQNSLHYIEFWTLDEVRHWLDI